MKHGGPNTTAQGELFTSPAAAIEAQADTRRYSSHHLLLIWNRFMLDRVASSTKRVAVARLMCQFLNFSLVGIPTTVLHYAILIGLVESWQVDPIIATTAGFSAAALLSYVLNRRYTFDIRPMFARGLVRYYAILFVGLLLNAIIVGGLMKAGAVYLFAQVVATGLVLVWNFLSARFVVFRS